METLEVEVGMFIKCITDNAESGCVVILLANDMGTGEESLLLSLGEWKRLLGAHGQVLHVMDEVDEALYDKLHLAAEKTAALHEAARMLSSGDKSTKEIRRKLSAKSFSAEAVDHAVAILVKKGYLNEEKACLRIAEAAVRSKHYGKQRIVTYLCSHGFEVSVAKNAAASIPEEIYREALVYQMQRKYPHASEMSRPEQQKMIAAMIRQGFSAGEVIRYLKEE